MIEELEMIKAIVGDLAGAGLWGMGAYIAYKLIINLVFYIGGGYLIHTIATLVYKASTADITRQDADMLRTENARKTAKLDAMEITHKSELDEVKAMYKILKEKKDAQ